MSIIKKVKPETLIKNLGAHVELVTVRGAKYAGYLDSVNSTHSKMCLTYLYIFSRRGNYWFGPVEKRRWIKIDDVKKIGNSLPPSCAI